MLASLFESELEMHSRCRVTCVFMEPPTKRYCKEGLEEAVGIQEFINKDHTGFKAIIKHR